MSNIEGLKEQARRHEQKEEWRKALELYQKAIDRLAQEDDPDIGLHNRVGDLYIRVGEIDSAVRALEQAVELYVDAELPNNAIAVCKKILRNVPDRHEVFLRMGQIRASQGFLVDARTHFLTFAERMQEAGQLDEALRALVEFADAAPEDTEIRLAIAGHFEQHDRIDEAVEQLGQGYASAVQQGQDQAADAFRARLEELRPGTDPSTFLAVDEPESDAFVVEATSLGGGEEESAPVEASGSDGLDEDWGASTGSVPDWSDGDDVELDVFSGADDDSLEILSDFDDPGDAIAEAVEEASGIDSAFDPFDGPASAETSFDEGSFDEDSLSDAIAAIGPDVSHLDVPADDDDPLEGLHVVQEDDLEFVAVVDDDLDDEPPLPLTTFHEAHDDFDPVFGDEPIDVFGGGGGLSVEGPDELPLVEFGAVPEGGLAPPVMPPMVPVFDEPTGPSETEPSSAIEAALVEGFDAAEDRDADVESVDDVLSGGLDGVLDAGEPDSEVLPAAVDDSVSLDAPVEVDDAAPHAEVPHAEVSDAEVSDAEVSDADSGEPVLEVDSEGEELDRLQRTVEAAHRAGDDAALADAYVGLGEALRRAGEEVRAVAVFREALQVVPDHAGARAGLDAAPPVERTVTEVASNEDYVDLGALILGETEEKTTRFVVAYEEPSGDEQADFAKMLSQFKAKVAENVDASDVKAHHDLGTAYKEMGLLDEAVEEFQAALRASADHLPTYEMLGQTFLDKGTPETAVRVLTRALDAPYEVEDELLGIYYYLGRSHEQSGNKEQALEFYERVFSLDINFADVTERLRALR